MFKKNFNAREARKGFSMVSIFLIYSLIFFVYPLVWMIILMFSKWNFISTPKFAGFYNIQTVLSSEIFWITILNTLRFMVFYIPIVLIASFLFALMLRRIKYGKTFIALSFLVAQVCSGVAYSIIFSKLLSPIGPINIFLNTHFHFTVPWFTSPNMAMFTIALIVTWKFVGYYGIIFYSGMNSISNSLYEAADLDGASKKRQFFGITLPLLNAQVVLVLVLSITLAFGLFTETFIITGGGPLSSTMTPMLVMYNAAFQQLQPTYAATMAVFVALISAGIVKVTKKIIERDVTIV